MAIYRSDQAIFTFASEGTPGAMPERATVSGSNYAGATVLTAQANAGDTQILVSSGSGTYPSSDSQVRGSYVVINYLGAAARGSSEIRRVIKVQTGDALTLDTPLSFTHTTGTAVGFIDSTNYGYVGSETVRPHSLLTDGIKYISWIPGIYETVDTPDVEESYEPRYMLGGASKGRGPFTYLRQQQSYMGAVAGIVLLNGWGLKYALGEVSSNALPTNTDAAVSGLTSVSVNKGEVEMQLKGSNINLATGSYVQFSPSTTSRFIRKVVQGGGSSLSNDAWIELNYPVPVALDATSGATANVRKFSSTPVDITHTINESTELPTFTWNVHVNDSAGTNAFQRRYYGGVLDSVTISGEEGGLLVMDWDAATFLGMVHNQTNAVANTQVMDKYQPMHGITQANVGVPGDTAITGTLPTTQPYYFHEGVITFNGSTVARLRSFSLSVSNSVESKYYVKENLDRGRGRGPTEIFEGPREYSMTATVSMENSTTPDTDSYWNLWKELVEQETTGFAATLEFRRGGDSDDYIKFTIPNDGTPGTGIGDQGLFINSAPANIDGANPMEQSVSMVFPSMKVEIKDNEPFYP